MDKMKIYNDNIKFFAEGDFSSIKCTRCFTDTISIELGELSNVGRISVYFVCSSCGLRDSVQYKAGDVPHYDLLKTKSDRL